MNAASSADTPASPLATACSSSRALRSPAFWTTVSTLPAKVCCRAATASSSASLVPK